MKMQAALYKGLLTTVLTLGLLLPAGSCVCGSVGPIVASSQISGENHCQSGQTSNHDCELQNGKTVSSSCCCKAAAPDHKAYPILQNNTSGQSLFTLGQSNQLDQPDLVAEGRATRNHFSEYPKFYSDHIYLLNSSLLI